MLAVESTGEILGATIRGADLSKPLNHREFATILKALGNYGVLRFPDQRLDPSTQRDFAKQFGDIHIASDNHPEGFPEISVLSNIVRDGRNIGYVDAGIIWHRDMVFREPPGFANVLYAMVVPRRGDIALGRTEFCNVVAAYRDLPDDIKQRIDGLTVMHSAEKYNRVVRGAGSQRPTFESGKVQNPPTPHPMVTRHPITGESLLYCDPSQAESILDMSSSESDELLEFVFQHQLQPKYRYVFRWNEHDVLMWDNIGTIHCAIQDYSPEEPRLIHRCQIRGEKIFNASFVARATAAS